MPAPRPIRATLRFTAPVFDWHALIFSHGWVYLAPFDWDPATASLTHTCNLTGDGAVRMTLRCSEQPTRHLLTAGLQSSSSLIASQLGAVRSQIRRMLRLDEDFSSFHESCKDDPVLAFVHQRRCGGLLRGASAFEDVIKTVCTVNCDWRNTKSMCHRLCDLAQGAFPTPAQLLRHSERTLAAKTRCGYRAKTLRIISRLFDAEKLPLDDWARQGDFERIRIELGAVWGIGPYALNHILVLLGDYSAIPVDGEVLRYLRETHFAGTPVSAKEAVTPYEPFGQFRFLAYKFSRMAKRSNYINK
jgi:3-methyladenine DNA glycosylase/8-oxoguanine DNA glycosylase